MITVKNLNKYYYSGGNKFHALKDMSFTIDDGDFVAIEGRSGAGKTTLLQILGCLDTFDSGTYYFKDIDIKNIKDDKSAKLRNKYIGFVLQDFSLINSKSVLFNAMLPLLFNKTPISQIKEKALNSLALVGVQDQANKKVNQLSGGQKQRVAIARAIVTDPAVILADEPTGALDSVTSGFIMELLKELNQSGITIVVVTHDNMVSDYCNKKLLIQDGTIIQSDINAETSSIPLKSGR